MSVEQITLVKPLKPSGRINIGESYVRRLLAIVFCLVISYNTTCEAQGLWSKAKEKASAAWNSDIMNSRRYTVPITERRFVNLIPDSYLLQLSDQQYRSYLNSNRRSTNAQQTAQVKRVAQRLSKAVRQLYIENGMEDELQNLNWEFNLVKNSSANAFCMPGGKIVVYDGLLPIAKDDASLAVVIGHEIGHAIAKHSSEQMTKKLVSVCGMAVVYAVISNSDMGQMKKKMAAIMASAGITLATLKFSRLNETEADRLGLILAAMAGYDPSAAIGFWQRMAEKSRSNSTHDWYSDHPSDANRIKNIKEFLPEAQQYRR